MSAYLEHRTQDGDRLDLLAWSHYGDATRFAPILQANPDLFVGGVPMILTPGVLLKIPILEEATTAPSESTPPWLR